MLFIRLIGRRRVIKIEREKEIPREREREREREIQPLPKPKEKSFSAAPGRFFGVSGHPSASPASTRLGKFKNFRFSV